VKIQTNQLEHALRMLKQIIGYFLVSKDFYGRLQLTEQMPNLRFEVVYELVITFVGIIVTLQTVTNDNSSS
jgi:hypothetical protein